MSRDLVFPHGHVSKSETHTSDSEATPDFGGDSRLSGPTGHRSVVFTAQSKREFYCRDAVCEYVFRQGRIPLNPFRVFGYFLGDRVDRDVVRAGNNNLIRISDELWVFGELIANGVLFEIRYAQYLAKPVRFFTIHNRAALIREVPIQRLRFEPELHLVGAQRNDLLDVLTGGRNPKQSDQMSLFREGSSADD